jgi:hypothetical protein
VNPFAPSLEERRGKKFPVFTKIKSLFTTELLLSHIKNRDFDLFVSDIRMDIPPSGDEGMILNDNNLQLEWADICAENGVMSMIKFRPTRSYALNYHVDIWPQPFARVGEDDIGAGSFESRLISGPQGRGLLVNIHEYRWRFNSFATLRSTIGEYELFSRTCLSGTMVDIPIYMMVVNYNPTQLLPYILDAFISYKRKFYVLEFSQLAEMTREIIPFSYTGKRIEADAIVSEDILSKFSHSPGNDVFTSFNSFVKPLISMWLTSNHISRSGYLEFREKYVRLYRLHHMMDVTNVTPSGHMFGYILSMIYLQRSLPTNYIFTTHRLMFDKKQSKYDIEPLGELHSKNELLNSVYLAIGLFMYTDYLRTPISGIIPSLDNFVTNMLTVEKLILNAF